MGWLRENWFDALIFLLLVAVVAAIVLFLVGLNPFARRPQPAVVPPAPPAAPVPRAEAEVRPAPAPASESAEEPSAAGYAVLPLPPAIEEVPEPTEEVPAGQEEGGSTPPPPQPASEKGTPKQAGRYRVSVGAFTRPEYAVDLAKRLKAKGYPVRIEVVGHVSRVVVGPYASREKAERVRQALAEYQPQVYRGDTPAPKGTYLQVGAFRSLERARALAKTLKEAGYAVVVYYRDGWAKVWVGPLEADQVKATRTKLEREGYQPVEVRGG